MLKQSRSKEQSLGKLMKVYVAQMLLNAGISSCQEQGINLLTEFLIKLIRKVGQSAKRMYELQGRQEGNIFHILLALDTLQINPTNMLTYFKNSYSNDASLNRVLTSVLEQIYPQKYATPEMDELTNLRQKPQLTLSSIFSEDSGHQKCLEDLLALPVYLKNQTFQRQKKEITEKELKEEKKKHQFQFEEDQFQKQLQKQRQRKENHHEFETLNPYNLGLKKTQTIRALDSQL